jgi:hypothetical protein
VPGWDALLDRLAEVPRENGTPALHETAAFLAAALRERGVPDVALVPFTAEPYRLRIAGAVILGALALYAWWLRRGRPWRALAVAVLLPVVLVAELDFRASLFGRLGAETAHHVVARIPARAAGETRLLLTAHYDTKTDLLDHVERAPVDLLAPAVGMLAIAGALVAGLGIRGRLRHLARAAAWVVPVWGLAAFAALSAGAVMRPRSPGALDDGAACAVLVRLAERLAAAPLHRTDVEVVLFAAEEVGTQGSWAWVRSRFAGGADVPTRAVNLDPIGASGDLAVLRRETFALGGHAADPGVVALLDRVHRNRRGRPLERTWYAGSTDARSFLAHGIPAATLLSRVPRELFPRHLHSAGDTRARIAGGALDATLEYLEAVARAADGARP